MLLPRYSAGAPQPSQRERLCPSHREVDRRLRIKCACSASLRRTMEHVLDIARTASLATFSGSIIALPLLYPNAPANEFVPWVDEQGQIQALDRIQDMLHLRPVNPSSQGSHGSESRFSLSRAILSTTRGLALGLTLGSLAPWGVLRQHKEPMEWVFKHPVGLDDR